MSVQHQLIVKIFIIHTNDLHGQIDPKVQELAYLTTYYKQHGDILLDAGDASQGLPINNISEGAEMGCLMSEMGYNAMTIGNHEFDYTLNHVIDPNQDGFFKSSTAITKLASNVYYEGTENNVFELSKIEMIKGIQFSMFGLATPETKTKADPRNSSGIEFRDTIGALRSEINKSEHNDSKYFIILAHLGDDPVTKEEWRGDTLANTLATDPDFVGKKFIVIDGHSHSEYANGEKYGSNVIYGQTKGTLETFGQITIDLSNFEASEAKTIKMRAQYALTETMKAYTTDPTIVAKLKDINDAFELATSKVVLPNLMVDLNGERADVRTGETNLGNLISDSMFEYAMNTSSRNANLAVMNGGGIRASIKPGSVSIKEIITTMPYGNRVVQIDVLGSDIYMMFEHGLKAPIAFDPEGNMLFDENGQPKLSQDPSILHVSDTVKLKFDPRRAAGDRITSLEILDQDTQQFEIVDLNRTYKLVTLEFLAVGGDGFTMLSGARQEGKTDSDIFADHFELNTIDWTKYAQDAPKRVAPLSFANLDVTKTYLASLKSANTALTNTKFTKASRDVLAVVLAEYEAITNKVKGVGDDKLVINAEYSTALAAINEAVSNLVKEVEKPVEPSDTNESATDRPDVNTGIYQDYPLFGLGLSIISLAGYVHLRKRKMTAEN